MDDEWPLSNEDIEKLRSFGLTAEQIEAVRAMAERAYHEGFDAAGYYAPAYAKGV